MENQTELKWYQKPTGVIILLIFFFPVGLYLMWKNDLWSKQTRLIITGVFAFFIIVNVVKPNKSGEIQGGEIRKVDKSAFNKKIYKSTNCDEYVIFKNDSVIEFMVHTCTKGALGNISANSIEGYYKFQGSYKVEGYEEKKTSDYGDFVVYGNFIYRIKVNLPKTLDYKCGNGYKEIWYKEFKAVLSVPYPEMYNTDWKEGMNFFTNTTDSKTPVYKGFLTIMNNKQREWVDDFPWYREVSECNSQSSNYIIEQPISDL